MAVSVIETIKSRANTGNTAYIVVVKLLCDDYSDLPTQSGLSGYELAQGCIAHVINENKDYMIDSGGNWHVYGGDSWTNVYTKSETDALLDDKQDELTTAQLDAVNSGITAAKLAADETALGEVINGGAAGTKNFLTENTKTETGQWTNIPVVLQAGSYVLAIGTLSSTDTDAATCQLGLFNSANQNLLGRYPQLNRGNNIVYSFEITSESSYLRVYSSDTTAHGTGDTVTVTNAMICRKTLYDANPEFEPYAPAKTNVEITPALVELVDNGAKNLFDYDVLGPNTTNIGTSIVVNGVRFTVNSDKSVTINRESSNSQDAYVWFRKSGGSAVIVTDFCDDEHVFSGASGASASTYRLYINNINGSNTYKYFGDGDIIGTPQVTPNAAGIYIAAGYSPSNLVIKPMICTKAAWDISHTFVPYCPSMAEMYQMILAL